MAGSLTDDQVRALPVQDYAAVRPGLRTGDLFFAAGNYLLSRAIRHLTKSAWSHVGVVVVLADVDRVLLLESVEDVGVRFAPLSKYLTDYDGGRPYDGMLALARPTFVTPAFATRLAAIGCDELTRPYDKDELGRIVARIVMNLPSPAAKKEGYICSELVHECFKRAGHTFAHADGYIAPEDIWRDPAVTLLARVQ